MANKKYTLSPEQTNEITAMDIAYARAFNTLEGKKVLEDLSKRFYDSSMMGDDLNREVGRRDVLHFIKQRVKRANA